MAPPVANDPGGEVDMRTRRLAVALGLPVALALAACGGGVESDGVASAGGGGAKRASAGPSQSLSPEDAQLKFAQCMRENGVDMPDPGSDGRVRVLGKGGDKDKVQVAMKKCQSYLQAGGKMPDMKDPKVRDQYVKFAQCMREHGVDMPDPGADGGLVFKTKPGSREKLDKARQACQSKLPGGGTR
jgi:hypothetical protein